MRGKIYTQDDKIPGCGTTVEFHACFLSTTPQPANEKSGKTVRPGVEERTATSARSLMSFAHGMEDEEPSFPK